MRRPTDSQLELAAALHELTAQVNHGLAKENVKTKGHSGIDPQIRLRIVCETVDGHNPITSMDRQMSRMPGKADGKLSDVS